MKNLKTQIFRIASVALLALGILGINQMASYSDPGSSPYTYVGSSSWASGGNGITSIYVTAQGTPNAGSGPILASALGWEAIGSANSVADAVAEDGSESAIVTGRVTFSRLVNRQRVDSIPALATFTCEVGADGSQTEGVEIVDQAGNVLAHVPLEPVIRGSLRIFH